MVRLVMGAWYRFGQVEAGCPIACTGEGRRGEPMPTIIRNKTKMMRTASDFFIAWIRAYRPIELEW